MMPAPVLVFDLDGTLVDTLPDLIGTLNDLLADEGMAAVSAMEAPGLVGQGAKAMLKRGLALNGMEPTEERLDELFVRFIARYEDRIAHQSKPFPGAVAAMDAFTAAGWSLAICTNKLERLAVKLLTELDLNERFAFISGPENFGVRKPDPRHIEETVRAAGGDPDRAVMVGDSVSDVEAAKAASIPVVGVSFGYTNVPIAELGPDHVIDHFTELADAVAALRPDLPRAPEQAIARNRANA